MNIKITLKITPAVTPATLSENLNSNNALLSDDTSLPSCPLCQKLDVPIWFNSTDGRNFHHCSECDFRFLAPKFRLGREQEIGRYHLHQASTEDLGYRRFVANLISAIETLLPKPARLLDFGAGHNPVLATWLGEMGYEVEIYDPLFWPSLPTGHFDGIVACEVVEHIFEPGQTLKSLCFNHLRMNGLFFLMTHVYDQSINFADWYYMRDPTHVSFFSRQSLQWLADSAALKIERETRGGRVAVFRK